MTPHTITVWSREDVTEDAARRKEILKEGHDKPLLEIPSTGVANCRPRREKCGDALGVPVYRETFTPADVDPVPGDGPTIVSAKFAAAYSAAGWPDPDVRLLTVADVVTDGTGRPVGCLGFYEVVQ